VIIKRAHARQNVEIVPGDAIQHCVEQATGRYLPTAKAFEQGGYEPRMSPFTAQVESDVISMVTPFIKRFRW
jgi:hypothetical protein